MSKVEITRGNASSIVIWQEVEEGVGEPAILLTPWSDVITITQEGKSINLNYETVKELCKQLKTLHP